MNIPRVGHLCDIASTILLEQAWVAGHFKLGDREILRGWEVSMAYR